MGRFKRKSPRTGRSVIKNGIQPLEDNEDFHTHLPATHGQGVFSENKDFPWEGLVQVMGNWSPHPSEGGRNC